MYLKVVSREEPNITVLSIRPGIVDTEMVRFIYDDPHNRQVMDAEQYKFMELQRVKGRLLEPTAPANAMANLVMDAGKELSGGFFSWDDPKINSITKVK